MELVDRNVVGLRYSRSWSQIDVADIYLQEGEKKMKEQQDEEERKQREAENKTGGSEDDEDEDEDEDKPETGEVSVHFIN